MKPTVGRIVHYVDHDEHANPYTKFCRAAIVTEVHGKDSQGHVVSVAVMHPDKAAFIKRIPEGDELPRGIWGSWHWPEREQ